MELKQADLLFIKNGHSELDDGIAQSTGDFVHVAIVSDEGHVIHATPQTGVCEQRLQSFLDKNKCADVYRADIKNRSLVVQHARKHLGKPYNFSFRPNTDGLYCSQLVLESFRGVVVFNEQPMCFGDQEKEISDFWATYYHKLGESVPLNVLGTNPNDMIKNPRLHFIGTIK
ncbi:UDP-N-acetylmuramoylalanyl-D-glutamate--2, 6-diaminopimelate ligase [Leuconostoc litchii]|uniref:Hydrolase n=1 Tax=Leuconostoc litchii TaxID=1981069 RepID=A0A6P2CMK2_9LACO|nr:YiiX/YebB-like N1pC/P60 family cysteine hydrolase [Leuconostoc litchii]TYC46175.1 hydrolase [Leuconostoc litchii]GMA70371.1 UDP-N-acetylmuramoylalanyl-D-glutamate--2, 6-diaminopimelate ligase [Leuconostoc litchii]